MASDEDPAAEEPRRFAHPDSTINYPGRPVYSRTREGPTSVGRRGRILLTAAVLGIAVALLMAFNYLPAPALVWAFIVTPLLLRAIWKKVPVGYVKPWSPEEEQGPR